MESKKRDSISDDVRSIEGENGGGVSGKAHTEYLPEPVRRRPLPHSSSLHKFSAEMPPSLSDPAEKKLASIFSLATGPAAQAHQNATATATGDETAPTRSQNKIEDLKSEKGGLDVI